MKFRFNDGGRVEAGYKGYAGDCVVRAISIGTGLPYQKVYDDLIDSMKKDHPLALGMSSVRDGVAREYYEAYLLKLGWKWIATMGIGSGCRVHLRAEELPSGTVIARVSRHLTTVIDGVIYDTFDPSRCGTRCVYGYFIKEDQR